jgi:hypothetical protein
MASQKIVWDVSETLYHEILQAQETLAFPRPTDLIAQAVQRYLAEVRHETWRNEFRQLQQQVRTNGGFRLGETKEDIIAALRKQRRQLFESNYADLY